MPWKGSSFGKPLFFQRKTSSDPASPLIGETTQRREEKRREEPRRNGGGRRSSFGREGEADAGAAGELLFPGSLLRRLVLSPRQTCLSRLHQLTRIRSRCLHGPPGTRSLPPLSPNSGGDLRSRSCYLDLFSWFEDNELVLDSKHSGSFFWSLICLEVSCFIGWNRWVLDVVTIINREFMTNSVNCKNRWSPIASTLFMDQRMVGSSEIASLLSSDCFLLSISSSYSPETSGILIKRVFVSSESSLNFLNYEN